MLEELIKIAKVSSILSKFYAGRPKMRNRIFINLNLRTLISMKTDIANFFVVNVRIFLGQRAKKAEEANFMIS